MQHNRRRRRRNIYIYIYTFCTHLFHQPSSPSTPSSSHSLAHLLAYLRWMDTDTKKNANGIHTLYTQPTITGANFANCTKSHLIDSDDARGSSILCILELNHIMCTINQAYRYSHHNNMLVV